LIDEKRDCPEIVQKPHQVLLGANYA